MGAKRNFGRKSRKKHQRRARPKRRSSAPNRRKRRQALRAEGGGERAVLRSGLKAKDTSATRPQKVGFVFSNDPDPMLIERMWALEETGKFETHAIYWHRNSDLSFPFCPDPFSGDRFTRVSLTEAAGANPVVRLWLTIVFAWSLWRWIRKQQLDVLHVVYPNMLLAAYMATIGRRVKIIYDVWDVNRQQTLGRMQRFFFRVLLSKTPQVFTTSQPFIDEFLVPNGILAPGTQVTNVSNAPYFRPVAGSANSRHQNDHPLVIGCVGNLRVPRQLQMLFEAVREVRATGRDVRIRLSGAGSRSRMVSEASEDRDFVEYTGPYDYRRDVADLYDKLDMVYAVYPLEIFNYRVHTARRLHDAVISGKPIVVSRSSHMGDTVSEQGIGWCIGHESTAELVDLLKDAYDHREEVAVRSTRAQAMMPKHTFAAYRDEYVDAYLAVAGLASVPQRQGKLLWDANPATSVAGAQKAVDLAAA